MCVEAAGRGGWRGYHQEAAAKNLLLLTKCFGSWCSNIPDRKQSKNSTMSVISAPSVKKYDENFQKKSVFPTKSTFHRAPFTLDSLTSSFLPSTG